MTLKQHMYVCVYALDSIHNEDVVWYSITYMYVCMYASLYVYFIVSRSIGVLVRLEVDALIVWLQSYNKFISG